MIDLSLFIGKAAIVTMFVVVVIIIAYLLVTSFIHSYYKDMKYCKVESFDVLLSILHSIIEVELQIYETNIFQDRNGLTNSNYANFYNDLCKTIMSHISKDMIEMLKIYVTEEFIYTLIARKVKAYLNSKVQ